MSEDIKLRYQELNNLIDSVNNSYKEAGKGDKILPRVVDCAFEDKDGRKRTAFEITTGIVGVAFPHLFEPHSSSFDEEAGKPASYSSALFIPTNSETAKVINDCLAIFKKRGIDSKTSSALLDVNIVKKHKDDDGFDVKEITPVEFFKRFITKTSAELPPLVLDRSGKKVYSTNKLEELKKSSLPSNIAEYENRSTMYSDSDIDTGTLAIFRIRLSEYSYTPKNSNLSTKGVSCYLQGATIIHKGVKLYGGGYDKQEIIAESMKEAVAGLDIDLAEGLEADDNYDGLV